MIDGVKILCIGTDWRVWQDHKDLDFFVSVSEKTGDIPSQTKEAKFNGLRFLLRPTVNDVGNFTPLIVGSLHKFHNDGEGNANVYTLADIQKTLSVLRDEFGVILESAVLQNLEFGLNIPLAVTVKKFLSGVISLPSKRLDLMNKHKPHLGRVSMSTEYGLKVYDKLMQQNDDKDGDLLRVEVAAKKARFLEKFNIRVLSDLEKPATLTKAGDYLMNAFSQIIYYDGGIDEKRFLKKKEVIRLREYCSGYYWERLDKDRRKRRLKHYKKMMLDYGVNIVKKNVLAEMRVLLEKVVPMDSRENGEKVSLFSKIGADKSATFSQFKCSVKRERKGIEKEGIKEEKEYNTTQTQKGRKSTNEIPRESENNISTVAAQNCLSCGRDISTQKDGSKYCSEKLHGRKARRCRDAGYHKGRQARRIAARKMELEKVAAVMEVVTSGGKICLTVFWIDGYQWKTTTAALVELPRPLRSVNLVSISPTEKSGRLAVTTRRAKSLLKEIMLHNRPPKNRPPK